jgi:hypothetical protein
MQKLFTFKDSWIWVLLNAFCIGAFVKAVVYQIQHGIGIHTGVYVVGGVVLTILGITLYRYIARWWCLKKWCDAPHTVSNMAVMSDQGLEDDYIALFNHIILTTVDFWSFWNGIVGSDTYEINKRKILDAMNGGTIFLVDQPIYRGNEFWSGKFLGIQEGNVITIVNKDKDQMLQLLKHELSHLCLTAIGVDPGPFGNKHHEIFAQTNFC